MTRMLASRGTGKALTTEDMRAAKEVLCRKAVVGLYSNLPGKVQRYVHHFGWENATNGGRLTNRILVCFKSSIFEGKGREMHNTSNLVDVDVLERLATSCTRIMERNKFDCELYLYSQHL
jgi:hypothetical protein